MIGQRSALLVGLTAMALLLAGCAAEGEGRVDDEDDGGGNQDGGDGGGGATLGAGGEGDNDGGDAPGPGAALAVMGALGAVAFLHARRN